MQLWYIITLLQQAKYNMKIQLHRWSHLVIIYTYICFLCTLQTPLMPKAKFQRAKGRSRGRKRAMGLGHNSPIAVVLLASLKVSAEVAVIFNRQSSRLQCMSLFVEQRLLYLKKICNGLKNPSIPPLSSTYLGQDCGGTRLRKFQISLSPATLPSSSQGIPRHSQDRWKI